MGVIYKITNKVNGKSYIGKTIGTVGHRWGQHKACVAKGKGDCYLYRAMRKYGLENFTVEVVDSALLDEELCAKEMEWIAKLGTANSSIGYNSTFGGQSGIPTPETRKKISGRPCSPETRRKISEAQIGKIISDEHRRSMSTARKGKPIKNADWLARMRANHPAKGKKRSPEQLERLSAVRKAQWTPEARDRMSKSQKAFHAISPRLAPVLTPEARARVTEKVKQRWAEMTAEERKARNASSIKAASSRLGDPEVIARHAAAVRASWTPERRAAYSPKMKAAMASRSEFAKLVTSRRQAIVARKREATKAGRAYEPRPIKMLVPQMGGY